MACTQVQQSRQVGRPMCTHHYSDATHVGIRQRTGNDRLEVQTLRLDDVAAMLRTCPYMPGAWLLYLLLHFYKIEQ